MTSNKEINELIEDIDRIIHEPARLLILIYLNSLAEVDYSYLLFKTGLSKGNLSSHLIKLEQSEYIVINKQFKNKTPLTTIYMTSLGKRKLKEYKDTIDLLIKEI